MNNLKLIAIGIFLIAMAMSACAPRYATDRKGQKNYESDSRKILDQLEYKSNSRENYRLFREIRFYLGTPYRFGGADRRGFDCSGFVMTIFREVYGIDLPHNAYQQYQKSTRISSSALMTGDLVFFDIYRSGKIDHVGIYLGDDYFVHASSSRGVVISNLKESYYRSRFAGAGRVL